MQTQVRGKFVCQSVTSNSGDQHEAVFTAVTTGSEENEKFFKYTPFGELKIGVLNKQYFEAGKEYYLDIIPAE